ncbi:murein hydrolase activator EnvC family protein [Aliiroseovarius crassostreae]|uniref:murein hydrolase activator EnvC family protein n=1 Tax=Aliiroseovarius crassostreae TaxID=154981 RepID=UPI003C7C0906
MARRLLTALLLCLPAGQVVAQAGPAADARAAMIALDVAGAALEDATSARDRVAALTQTVKAYETGLSALREGLRRASLREATIQTAFDAESDRLAQLLGVLQTIEKAPEPSLLIHPDGPIGTARSGMILSDVAPALQNQADTLRQGLEELATIRALQEGALDTLQNGLAGAQTARAKLSQAIAARTELPRRFVQDKAAMQALIESSDTLASFASGLLSDPVSPQSAGTLDDFASAKGRLDLPVLGRLLRGFNDSDAAGVKRPGWVIATRPLALVTTPWPATIRYLGPLLDYGNVAILEPGDGYLMVLAGLGQLYGEVGEVLAQGAPIGLMGGAAPEIRSEVAENGTDQAFLIELVQGAGTEASETLYIELRENQTPVDPADWFTAGKE